MMPTGTERPSLRERKKLATRRLLQRTALELVAQKGYANVTVEDIAQAAEISPRTFFNYFSSKEAALFGFDPEREEALRQRLVEQPVGLSPLEALRAVFVEEVCSLSHEVGELGGDTATWLRRMKEAQGDPQMMAARAAHAATMERALAAGLAERMGVDVQQDPYPVLAVSTAMGGMRAAMRMWAQLGETVELAALVDAVFRALGQGLPPDCLKELVDGKRKGRSR
jgi:AcrR family transcriptional regulator